MLSYSNICLPRHQTIQIPWISEHRKLCANSYKNLQLIDLDIVSTRKLLKRRENRLSHSLRATAATTLSSKSKEYFVPASLAAVVWRASWRGIWLQSFLSAVSTLALFCAISLQRLPAPSSAISAPAVDLAVNTATVTMPAIAYWMCSSGAMATALALFFGMVRIFESLTSSGHLGLLLFATSQKCDSQVHLIWTWGYTRAAIKLRAMVTTDTEGQLDEDEALPPAADAEARNLSVRLRRSIDTGASIGLASALLAGISAQQVPCALAPRPARAADAGEAGAVRGPPPRLRIIRPLSPGLACRPAACTPGAPRSRTPAPYRAAHNGPAGPAATMLEAIRRRRGGRSRLGPAAGSIR